MCQATPFQNLIFPLQNKEYEKQIITLAEQYCNEDEISFLTSGSTGQPKSITRSKKHIHNSTLATAKFFGLDFKSHMLLALSPGYVAGKMMIYRALEYNCRLTCIPASHDLMSILSESDEFDFVALVPKQLQEIFKHAPSRLHQFKKILIGGAPIHQELEDEITAIHDDVYISYGMTETVSHCAIRKLGTSTYQAVENVSFDTNKKNELIVKAPQLSGEEQLQTNDIVKLHDSTAFEWLGRSDFVINSGGHKIHPEKIESQIRHIFTGEIIALGVPDETWGEKLILLSEDHVSEAQKRTVKSLLHPYEVPKSYIEVPKILRNSNHKIDRIANRQSYWDEK